MGQANCGQANGALQESSWGKRCGPADPIRLVRMVNQIGELKVERFPIFRSIRASRMGAGYPAGEEGATGWEWRAHAGSQSSGRAGWGRDNRLAGKGRQWRAHARSTSRMGAGYSAGGEGAMGWDEVEGLRFLVSKPASTGADRLLHDSCEGAGILAACRRVVQVAWPRTSGRRERR
jgi:hypothetical protein